MDRRGFLRLLATTAASMALVPTLCADTSKGSVATLPPQTDTLKMMLDNYAEHFGSYPARDSCGWVVCKVMAHNVDDTNAAIRACYESVTPEALLRQAVIARNKRAVIEGTLRRMTPDEH